MVHPRRLFTLHGRSSNDQSLRTPMDLTFSVMCGRRESFGGVYTSEKIKRIKKKTLQNQVSWGVHLSLTQSKIHPQMVAGGRSGCLAAEENESWCFVHGRVGHPEIESFKVAPATLHRYRSRYLPCLVPSKGAVLLRVSMASVLSSPSVLDRATEPADTITSRMDNDISHHDRQSWQ